MLFFREDFFKNKIRKGGEKVMGSLLEKFKGLEGIEKERKIRMLTEKDIGHERKDYFELFTICNAFWIYNGEGPHALLVSGRHSDGYIDCSQVLKFTNLRDILAERMVEEILLPNIAGAKIEIDYVASSSMAAISAGDGVATYLGATFIYCEKASGIQKLKRFEIPDGAKILQVEELITTMKTTRQVTNAIIEKNKSVEFVKDENGKIVVLTLVHRPEKLPIEYPDYRILPLVELEIHNWDAKNCPLCKAGSRALKPKENRNLFFKI